MPHPLTPLMPTAVAVPLHALPSRAWFERTLDLIGRFYRFIDLAELERGIAEQRPLGSVCHLTFDDGHRTFAETAMPVLQARGIPASLFVSPAVIAGGGNYWFQEIYDIRRRLPDAPLRSEIAHVLGCQVEIIAPFPVMSVLLSMRRDDIALVIDGVRRRHGLPPLAASNISVTELVAIADSGLVTVGAHTLDHPVLANESDERAVREIQGSVEQLSRLLGRAVTAFAYPNGLPGLDFGTREQTALRAAGIRLAFSSQPAFIGPAVDPLAVPRGGCPNLDGEPALYSTLRLLALPWWDSWRRAIGRTASERREREAIQSMTLAR